MGGSFMYALGVQEFASCFTWLGERAKEQFWLLCWISQAREYLNVCKKAVDVTDVLVLILICLCLGG